MAIECRRRQAERHAAVSLFCAATGLKLRPRASMDKAKIRELLKLADAQIVFLNHPVGYAK